MVDYRQLLRSISRQTRTGYILFDREFKIREKSIRFSRFFDSGSKLERNADIREFLPEIYGFEDLIFALQEQPSTPLTIEQVNKISASGSLRYFNLVFSTLKLKKSEETATFLCLIDEITEMATLEQAVRQQRYEFELAKTQFAASSNFLTDGLLGQSPEIEEVRQLLNKIAQHRPTVLIQGESGTGKSLVAKLIHNTALGAKLPFVEINCAAIPASLIESELFGYEKGAFTNAITSKKGLLEEADGGTLFLDEIGELPISVQAKLLSFLENRTFRRLGSTEEKSVQLQLIAATNKDLQRAVQEQEFRQDLFYRVHVISLRMPALRELENDILLLANHFIRIFAFDFKKHVDGLSKKAQQKLLHYDWPGNVRELRNVVERAMIFCDGNLIDDHDLVLWPVSDESKAATAHMFQIPDEGLRLEDIEQELLKSALKKSNGNQSRAALLLGLSLDTFRYRMKKFNIAS